VSGNPLTFTDPSEMFLSAICVGAETGNPVGVAIGAAIDIGEALFGIFGFGGAAHADLSSIAWTPSSVQTNSSDAADVLGGGDASSVASQSSTVGLYPTPVVSWPLKDVEYFIAGLADGLSFGLTARTRASRGLQLPPCGGAYSVREWTPFVFGGLRLSYAASAKAIPSVVGAGTEPLTRALAMSEVRNQLKVLYRFGQGGGYRIYTPAQILGKYGAECRQDRGNSDDDRLCVQ
jgi:hypothetical protein